MGRRRTLIFVVLACAVAAVLANGSFLYREEDGENVRFLKEWTEHRQITDHTAGVLFFADESLRGVAEELSALHEHLDFVMTNDKRAAKDLGHPFPSMSVVRDGTVLNTPKDFSRETFDEIDLWLSVKWLSRVTSLTIENQVALFDHMGPPIKIVLMSSSPASDATLAVFNEVASVWYSSTDLRTDLPAFIYATKDALLDAASSDSDIEAARTFWKQLSLYVCETVDGDSGCARQSIVMIHKPRGERARRAFYEGDSADKMSLGAWVAKRIKEIRGGASSRHIGL